MLDGVKMKLHILFGMRKQQYEGQYAPEAMECWDEFCVDENPGGFERACKQRISECGGDDEFDSIKVIVVKVDADRIYDLLCKPPEIDGKLG